MRERAMGLYFNGKKIGDVLDSRVTYNIDKQVEAALSTKADFYSATATFICTPIGLPFDWKKWFETLRVLRKKSPRPKNPRPAPRMPYSASFETLMRRASYGGRKGRRAMRRLMAMPDSVWAEKLP